MRSYGDPDQHAAKSRRARKTIIATAETLKPDLLVIGAHSKRSVFDVVLGGTAAYVSRHALCPVIMVKPGEMRATPATV